jgi:hypothetical protein
VCALLTALGGLTSSASVREERRTANQMTDEHEQPRLRSGETIFAVSKSRGRCTELWHLISVVAV